MFITNVSFGVLLIFENFCCVWNGKSYKGRQDKETKRFCWTKHFIKIKLIHFVSHMFTYHNSFYLRCRFIHNGLYEIITDSFMVWLMHIHMLCYIRYVTIFLVWCRLLVGSNEHMSHLILEPRRALGWRPIESNSLIKLQGVSPQGA